MFVLGTVCISIVGYQLFRFLFNIFYTNLIAIKLGINAVDLKDAGKWAVVTGCTDGLGKAYAEYLAKKGLNIVLISRNKTKLEAVAEQIETKYNVETKIIVADFSEGEKIYHLIEKELGGMDIGILINNVGISYSYPEYFLDVEEKEKLYSNIINCNILSVTHMCKIVLPTLVEKKKGVIVNIGSVASQVPSPLLTVYAASKAYVEKFSEDLETEYHKHGITIQCVLPGYVATKMSKIRSSTWMAPSPKEYVNKAIKTIGIHKQTTGYFPHALFVTVINIIQRISPTLNSWFIMRSMLNIRARALRHKSKA